MKPQAHSAHGERRRRVEAVDKEGVDAFHVVEDEVQP
jgi:hypothetical protein